jgi:hypothetical protein
MASSYDPNLDSDNEDGSSKARLFRFARRLMDRKDIAEDTKDILVSLAATSERAKNDAVKLIAREVRSYLQELKADEIVKEVLSGYTLEVSMRLQPIKGAGAEASEAEDILGQAVSFASEE